VDSGSTLLVTLAIVVGSFAAYNLFHYILYLLVIHPKKASNIGHLLNDFERRQLIEWTPKANDFLKHDDENRTYDDVFGPYRGENDNYSTCVFPRAIFTHPYESDYALLKPMQQGMRLLDLGCGSGAAADYFASQCNVEIKMARVVLKNIDARSVIDHEDEWCQLHRASRGVGSNLACSGAVPRHALRVSKQRHHNSDHGVT
jgi:hypothetical protein